ncbi:hypothetical protein VX037_01315 [Gordonia sp. Z-3]|jgi:hypothetical protein|uniref:Uncharacterized protein n=2 Tax=Gordonia TaxID=2053 RepID=A0A9X3D5B8_9ACTN|nr:MULTISPECIES: hypothetical protein [Gordonia]MAU84711.1 hypothetical protein [Gordonia sp. (in: high G+C Gram-positive bacteria)]MCF3940309.1 hypothetical protein [Gordonia tangerina]MCX2965243.1 hypothetical protein [Gordonia aquimaris]MED5799673.1 hypothetical protein [Gordonia sp. Z-3]
MDEYQPDHTDDHADRRRPDRHPAHAGHRARRRAVDWPAMERWLVESMADMGRAAILDIGPAVAHPDDEHDVDCAQIQVLASQTYLVRLSTTLMSVPLLASQTVGRDALDRWFYDDTFADCTHGFLMSRSRRRVAEIVVTWFRDRCGFAAPDELGCSYQASTILPRSAPTDPSAQRQGYP